ncbi:hypothetical protein WwAna1198 [Wolbachia endosymbiont of Drosophila ananassae]|nr:hypothetical protein WwAna1198 [Wolbachia endosymbiont of Drosophila ananassae]
MSSTGMTPFAVPLAKDLVYTYFKLFKLPLKVK